MTACLLAFWHIARGQVINRVHEICLEGESIIDSKAISARLRSEIDAPLYSQEAVAVAAVAAAHDQQAVLIVVLTGAGLMGRLIAKYHPVPPVLLVCESDRVARQAYLSRGLAPMVRTLFRFAYSCYQSFRPYVHVQVSRIRKRGIEAAVQHSLVLAKTVGYCQREFVSPMFRTRSWQCNAVRSCNFALSCFLSLILPADTAHARSQAVTTSCSCSTRTCLMPRTQLVQCYEPFRWSRCARLDAADLCVSTTRLESLHAADAPHFSRSITHGLPTRVDLSKRVDLLTWRASTVVTVGLMDELVGASTAL